MRISDFFCRFSNTVADACGKPVTFILALSAIFAWAASGPIFGFSETWQLVVNTGTTIVTFLMVFVLQNSQNRDGKALQAKLDELILTSEAENRFMGIEELNEAELARLRRMLQKAAEKELGDHSQSRASGLVKDDLSGAAKSLETENPVS